MNIDLPPIGTVPDYIASSEISACPPFASKLAGNVGGAAGGFLAAGIGMTTLPAAVLPAVIGNRIGEIPSISSDGTEQTDG